MNGRRLDVFVMDVREVLTTANRIRYLRRSELDGVPVDLLRQCAASLRAASYSALTAARTFEHRADLEERP